MKGLWILGLLWVAIIFASALWLASSSCKRQGGTLVRGAYWFECVDKQKLQEVGVDVETPETEYERGFTAGFNLGLECGADVILYFIRHPGEEHSQKAIGEYLKKCKDQKLQEIKN